MIKGIPIVALTANVRGEDYDRCMAVGMNDYLTKPLTLKELGVSLSRWLGANAIQPIPERSPVREHEVTPPTEDTSAVKAAAPVPPAPKAPAAVAAEIAAGACNASAEIHTGHRALQDAVVRTAALAVGRRAGAGSAGSGTCGARIGSWDAHAAAVVRNARATVDR